MAPATERDPAPLRHLQQRLQQIYEIEAGADVIDHLTTDGALAHALSGDAAGVRAGEQLLVRQDGEWLELSLYLAEAVIEHLGNHDPIESLHAGNLAEFCTALEGVSHFVCVAWNARHDRSVSLLELELQAEVDKFIVAAHLLGDQNAGLHDRDLLASLFREVSFLPELDDEQRHRYWWANRYAQQYCQHLQQRFMHAPRPRRMLNELRRFYRLPREAKIRRIHAAS